MAEQQPTPIPFWEIWPQDTLAAAGQALLAISFAACVPGFDTASYNQGEGACNFLEV